MAIDPAKGLVAGNVRLRSDKRPRPIVLRMNSGDCLRITFTNLLSYVSDPRSARHSLARAYTSSAWNWSVASVPTDRTWETTLRAWLRPGGFDNLHPLRNT